MGRPRPRVGARMDAGEVLEVKMRVLDMRWRQVLELGIELVGVRAP